MELDAALKAMFALDPAAPALEFEGKWLSWRMIGAAVDQLDDLIADQGFGADTPIAVLLRNRPPLYAAILAILRSRRCLVTFNPLQPAALIRDELLQLRPPVLVALATDWDELQLADVATRIGAAGIALPEAVSERARLVVAAASGSGGLMPDQPGVAIQMLTSGTTGRPKRVNLQRRQLEHGLTEALSYERARGDGQPKLRTAVEIMQTPFVHIGGVFSALNATLAGRRICLLERFTVPAWRDAVVRHRPVVAFAPPTALRMILDADLPAEDLASLRALRSATAPLAPEVVDAFLHRYGIPVLENYGATEFAGGVAGWTIDDFNRFWSEKRGSVGRLNKRIEGRVVDPDTHAPRPAGEPGLLELRGQQLDSSGAWVRTTDLARVDADGFLFILGRADNAIIRGGFKIMPDALVDVLQAHPAVREAAVVALPDERLGQVPGAAVILKTGAGEVDGAALQNWVRRHMTPYSVPTVLKVVDDLPRTSSMKVSAVALRALLLGDANGEAAKT